MCALAPRYVNTISKNTCDGDEQLQLYIVGNVSAMDLQDYQQYHDDGTLCRDGTLDQWSDVSDNYCSKTTLGSFWKTLGKYLKL